VCAAISSVIFVSGITAMATQGRRADTLPFAEYMRRWRVVHGLEPDRMSGGALDLYYRMPYCIAVPLARWGLTPNVVTVIGLVVTLVAIPPLMAGGAWPLVAGILILQGGLADQLDGCVAMLTDSTSTYGAIWDSTVDRLCDLALLAGPAVFLLRRVGGRLATWGVIGLAAAGAAVFLLEYVRARCQAVGFTDAQIITPAERPTRVIVASAAALLMGLLWLVPALRPLVGWVWAVGGWALAALTVGCTVVLLRDAAQRASGSGVIGGDARAS
jgi:CDP-diacylglycerol--glycerol-3-phosphate 3-phosphatidyltransferase